VKQSTYDARCIVCVNVTKSEILGARSRSEQSIGRLVGVGKGMLASVGRLGYSTAIISYETLHFRPSGNIKERRPMMLRYAHLLRQTLSGIRTGAAVVVVSRKCEVKGGLMNFFCHLHLFYWRGGTWALRPWY